ncbi:hypothetical protein BJ508DRAFT_333282 [Ascobolus immersus RN42]|uniref:Uncharacterized protein n=1 Tax=Ascobolus immersus RN42 TaxID=1160509 RepID=A0A3N4HK45_ASCIM|nr:hypothetical protein BJ508DRAFT_333282 [Ascobolus immersus RN42]
MPYDTSSIILLPSIATLQPFLIEFPAIITQADKHYGLLMPQFERQCLRKTEEYQAGHDG